MRQALVALPETTYTRPELAQCDRCGLKGRPMVNGYGPDRADVVICGEAPGPVEARWGLPFVGRSGQLLDKVLAEVGLNRDDCYVTNVCICTPDPVRAPKPKEIAACRPRLVQEILSHQPKVVLALGNTALKALTSRRSISDWHGAVIDSTELLAAVVPTYHPAAVLRSPRLYADMLQDIQKALLVLKGQFTVPKTVTNVTTVVLESTEDIQELVERLEQLEEVAVDVEVGSSGQLLCIGLSWKPGTAVVVPRELLGSPQVVAVLDKALGRLKLIGHNLKYDLQVLWRHGMTSLRTGADTMLEHYVMNELPGTHGLKQLAKDFLNMPEYDSALKPYHKVGFECCPPEILHQYNAKDVSYTYQIHQMFQKMLDQDNRRVLEQLLYPASDVLARMESLGVLLDVPKLKRLDVEYTEAVDSLIKQLHQAAGKEFNPNSYKQLIQVLYKDLDLPVPGRLSTDEDALTAIKDYHCIVGLLLDYRAMKKMHSTYIKALLEAADENGRVHTTFNLHGTVTGRLSSSSPVNLQNIPRDSVIRDVFIATPGYTLVEGDLSQAEIRGLAYYSRDPALIEAVTSTDVHIRTACLMFRKKPEEITKELRQSAKHLSFGVIYQMSAESLAQELNISVPEAQELIDRYFSAFPQAREWIEAIKQEALGKGMVKTPFGRVRRFGFITRENRNEVLRQAVNAPIQSLASDVTLSALIRAGKALENNNDTRLLLTVHDSILLETKEDPMEVARWLKEIMSAPVLENIVPFTADVKIGSSWGSLKEVNFE